MMFENGKRIISRRVEILRNGVVWGILEPTENPSVSAGIDRELKMIMQGAFRKKDGFKPERDVLKPIMTINGTDYPVGEFIVSSLKEKHAQNLDVIEIDAYDKTLVLKQSRTEGRLHIAHGTTYMSAIQALLTQDGIDRAISDECAETLQTDREDWEPGTPHLTIINDLLKEINFQNVWFDLRGNARLRKKREQTPANIDHTYNSGEFSIIKPICTRSIDIYEIPNVFIAMVSNADYAEAMIAMAENNNPSSILSIGARGRRIVAPIEKLQNIASQAELQAYVDKKRDASMLSEETVTFETANVPTHEVGDVIALNHEVLHGLYTETQWSMRLGAGETMTHTARR